MKTYFIFSFLFSIVITQSCNTGDRQIQQRCFNLVNQQLSWSEARNYCHNRNSYLATVPEQTTDSYLASYARTSFNINEGNFWIGLYRNSTTSKWQWDDGTPFAWNNFENPNLNYVAESIKNGKWNTFVAETRLNFVCSYYPNGAPTEPVTGSTEPPHWTTTESETVTPTESSSCTPSSPRTYLVAYSTDFDRDQFQSILNTSVGLRSDKYVYLANVRFDLQHPEDVEIHSDWDSWDSSVNAHMPNPSQGFSDSRDGSDILSIIDKFLDNPNATVCGAVIHVLLHRYPNEINIDDLVTKIRRNHVVVSVVIPTNDSASGGLYPETMYNLATRTNGLGFFSPDYQKYYLGVLGLMYNDYDPYQVYAVNVNVSGIGSMTLPDLSLPLQTYYNFFVTLQDDGVLSTFQSINLTVTSPYQTYQFPVTRGINFTNSDCNYVRDQNYMYPDNCAVTFAYNYSNSDVQTLQIRISSISATDYWTPYAN